MSNPDPVLADWDIEFTTENPVTALGWDVGFTSVIPSSHGDSVVIDPNGAFLIENLFSEIGADTSAQETAQTNLGFGGTDPLAYYILAKA